MDFEFILANVDASKPRRVRKGGRWFLVAQSVGLLEKVLNGSRGPLFYPGAENTRDPGAWNRMPLVVGHPFETNSDGSKSFISARSPDVIERDGVGDIFNAKGHEDGKLSFESWFDEELTKNYDTRNGTDLYPRLVRGDKIEMSTGLFTQNDIAELGANHNGVAYEYIARNHKPDHVAVLLNQEGACSVKDGCGINVNEECKCVDKENCKCGSEKNPDGTFNEEQQTIISKFVEWLTSNFTSNRVDQPHSQNTGRFKKPNAGTGKGEIFDAAMMGALNLSDQDKTWGADAAKRINELGQDPPAWVTDQGKWTKAKEAAATGNHAEDWPYVVAIYQRLGGQIDLSTNSLTDNEEIDMAATRDQNVQWLVANCPCYKGREKLLGNKEEFTDEQIVALRTNAEKLAVGELAVNALSNVMKTVGAPADMKLNEVPAFIQEKMDEKEEGDEEETEETAETNSGKSKGKSKAKATANQGKAPNGLLLNDKGQKMSMMEILGTYGTADEVAFWQTVTNQRQSARKALIAKLTANIKDEAERKEAEAEYNAMKITTLERIAKNLTPATNADAQGVFGQDAQIGEVLNYFGAAGNWSGAGVVPQQTTNSNGDESGEGTLPTPTINWKDRGGPDMDAKRRAMQSAQR